MTIFADQIFYDHLRTIGVMIERFFIEAKLLIGKDSYYELGGFL